jgi:putative ABC transport system ATP-binding protein
MLRVDSLTKAYGGQPVFREVSLALQPGEFVALLGESGVGKSTLLNCIAGLDRADSGRITNRALAAPCARTLPSLTSA